MSGAPKPTNRFAQGWGPIAAMALGAIMTGLAINSALQPAGLPYEKAIFDALPETFKAMALPASETDLQVKKLEWRVPGVRGAVAEAFVATDADGRNVPLDWRNNVTEPVLSADQT
ncbi:MAG: hypothetical protein ABL893_16020, partial [Hyphomicrobium sp.]